MKLLSWGSMIALCYHKNFCASLTTILTHRDEYYHKKPHEGISEYYSSIGACVPAGGITPEQEWNRDTRALKYLDG